MFAFAASFAFVFLFGICGPAHAQTWMNSAWRYRSEVSISNPNGNPLANFQVKVTLDASFDFAHAQSNGADLRVTSSDGVTLIPFWIADWRAGNTAAIWVQIPTIPEAGATIWLYYGNSAAASASNGRATFSFFDDFEATSANPAGYFPLSAPQLVFTANAAAQIPVPHTMSVVQANSAGFTYAAYVGSQGCGGIGIARSTDLSNWQEPVRLNSLPADARWPSVVVVNGTYYMLYEANYCSTSSIALATSTDGINFTTVKTIVPPAAGFRNQNPNLFFNPNDQKFYIYWFRGQPGRSEIRVRSASTVENLSDGGSEVLVLSSSDTLAAPNLLYFNGLYFLSAEIVDSNILWNTQVFYSTSPTGGFQPLANSPLLTSGNACMSQHVFDNVLHIFNCTAAGTVWTVTHRTAPLKISYGVDPARWTAIGGDWKLVSDTEASGAPGRVLMGALSAKQYLMSSFKGTDYVLESNGRQIDGRVWGIGVRANSANNSFYSANLYDDLTPSNNLVTYFRPAAGGVRLATASGGPVQPGEWYNLSIRVHSNEIDVYKDDILRSQAFDGNLQSGAAVLYGEAGTVAEFDNLFVRQYAPVDPVAKVVTGFQFPSPPSHSGVNVAAAANGATARASSYVGEGYAPSGAIDGDRRGLAWGNGGGWNDGNANVFPDWLEVDFASSQTINEVDVFTLQDNYQAPIDPQQSTTFSKFGITDFQVEYWDGSVWTVVPGGNITGNNRVWQQIAFAPITTSRIRALVTGALNSWSRITEIEAYSAVNDVSSSLNVASAANGATVTASSFYNAAYAPDGAIDGDRNGTHWGNGGGWNNSTVNHFPDWIQINFAGAKSISEIDVFTVQDNYAVPSGPTPSMTFSLYGITDFQVQFWDGFAWVNVPNGSISANNLVWRRINFPALTTSSIRIMVTGALNGYSRITEVEAH